MTVVAVALTSILVDALTLVLPAMNASVVIRRTGVAVVVPVAVSNAPFAVVVTVVSVSASTKTAPPALTVALPSTPLRPMTLISGAAIAISPADVLIEFATLVAFT